MLLFSFKIRDSKNIFFLKKKILKKNNSTIKKYAKMRNANLSKI